MNKIKGLENIKLPKMPVQEPPCARTGMHMVDLETKKCAFCGEQPVVEQEPCVR